MSEWRKAREVIPPLNTKVIIASPNYTAIGYCDGKKWYRWIDFPNGEKIHKSVEEPNVLGWQPLPEWTYKDFQ